jgi:hypothetical protein
MILRSYELMGFNNCFLYLLLGLPIHQSESRVDILFNQFNSYVVF